MKWVSRPLPVVVMLPGCADRTTLEPTLDEVPAPEFRVAGLGSEGLTPFAKRLPR